MLENKKDRIRLGIVIGLSIVLLTIVSLRYLKSKTAEGVLVPVADVVKMSRLPIPEKPSHDSANFQKRQEQPPSPRLLTLPRDIFRPTKLPPIRSEKSLDSKDSDAKKSAPTFKLKGTITGGSEPLAIIDDRFVRRGDVIKDYTVARIGEDKVILRSGKNVINLEVFKVIDPRKP